MKKSFIYVAVLILACALTGTITYIVLDSKEDNNNDKNTDNAINDDVEFVSIKEDGDKIIEEFKVTLNGKEETLKLKFNYYSDSEEHGIKVTFGDYSFVLFAEFFEFSNGSKDSLLDPNKIKTIFNEDNFQIITGKDNKNYLLLIANSYDTRYPLDEDRLYIFNDELELITGDYNAFTGCGQDEIMTIKSGTVGYDLENDIYPWYADELNVCKEPLYCRINLKIKDNKIYYLIPILNSQSEEKNGVLEERVYTINNSKLEYEVINSYKITNIAFGQACY